MSQRQLAIDAGVSQRAISCYENGLDMPKDHAVVLFHRLRMAADRDVRHMLDALVPSDLPRPWETVRVTLASKDNTYVNADLYMVAG